jgi:hypothetical protein
MSNVIDLAAVRARLQQAPVDPVLEALDALAVALVGHGHVWTDHERALYEAAVERLCPGNPAAG